jgi:hypothetical protein
MYQPAGIMSQKASVFSVVALKPLSPSYATVLLYLYMKEYDGAYFVFTVNCLAVSLMKVKQVVTIIQIRHTHKNTLIAQ